MNNDNFLSDDSQTYSSPEVENANNNTTINKKLHNKPNIYHNTQTTNKEDETKKPKISNEKITRNPETGNSANNACGDITSQEDDDEVLLINFDVDWGEDGEFMIPQPIQENVKREPVHEDTECDNGGIRNHLSNRVPIIAVQENAEIEESAENESQISQRAIDALHCSQDLDATNIKFEHSQYQSQKNVHLQSDNDDSRFEEELVENENILGHNMPNEIITRVEEDVNNSNEINRKQRLLESGLNNDASRENINELTVITILESDQPGVSEDSATLDESVECDVVIPTHSTVDHVPLQEPKVDTEEYLQPSFENEILIKHHPLMEHFLNENDPNNEENLETVDETLLPYSISYQAFYTCKECQFKTNQESDLQRHLAESHVNVVPDVSALLALDRNTPSCISENEGGINIENIESSASSVEHKVRNLSMAGPSRDPLKLGYGNSDYSRSSKPTWSLQEWFSSDEDPIPEKRTSSKKGSPSKKRSSPKASCPQCHYIEKDAYKMKLHLTFAHSTGTGSIKCVNCNFTGRRAQVWKHMASSHFKKTKSQTTQLMVQKVRKKKKRPMLRCQYCSYITTLIQNFREHLQYHEKRHSKVYQCPVCPAKYFKAKLTQHIKKWHPLEVEQNLSYGQYSCPKCSFKCFSDSTFEHHLFVNKGLDVCDPNIKKLNPMVADINDVVPHSIPSVKDGYNKTPVEQNLFQCSQCPYSTKFKHLLKRHEHYHRSGHEMAKCPDCDFWGTKLGVVVHKTRKHGTSPKSKTTNQANPTKVNLTESFICHKCNFKMPTVQALQVHLENNKNLPKCTIFKQRARPKKVISSKRNSSVNWKESLTKDKDGLDIVTVEMNDIDNDETDTGTFSDGLVICSKRYGGTLTITPVIEENISKLPKINKPRVSVIQDLRFYRKPNLTIKAVNSPVPTAPTISIPAPVYPPPVINPYQVPPMLVPPPLCMPTQQPHNAPTNLPLQTYKCKMCVFITNNETAIKDHINNHLLMKHHTPDKNPLFMCQKCQFNTRIEEEFRNHITTFKDRPNCVIDRRKQVVQRLATLLAPATTEDVIEIDSDDESPGESVIISPKTNVPKDNIPTTLAEMSNKKCFRCKYETTNQGDFYSHARLCINTKSNKCVFCEYKSIATAFTTGITAHMRLCHSKEYTEAVNKPAKDAVLQFNLQSPKPRETKKNLGSKLNQRSKLPPLIPFRKGVDSSASSLSSEMSAKGEVAYESSSNSDCQVATSPTPTISKKKTTVSPLKICQCSHCNFMTTDPEALKLHQKSHDLTCQECGFATPSKLVYQGHIDSHILDRQKSISTLHVSENMLPTTPPAPVVCQLPMSVKNPHQDSFACTECDYVTKNQINFMAHRELHIKASEASKVRSLVSYNIQPAAGQNVSIDVYQCKECTYETSRMSELQIHQQSHQSTPVMKPYSCDYCNYKSVCKDSLQSHYKECHEVTENISAISYYTKEREAIINNRKSKSESEHIDSLASDAATSDASDTDYKSSKPNDLKPAMGYKKRKLNYQLIQKQMIKKKRIMPSTSNESDLNDLEQLLNEKEMLTKEIKKEIAEENQGCDLEDLLDYIDIKQENLDEETQDSPNKKKTLVTDPDVIEILSDSEDEKSLEKQRTDTKKDKEFTCRQCGQFTGKSIKEVKKHIVAVHRKTFTCRKCEKFSSKSLAEVRLHVMEAHQNRMMKCRCAFKTCNKSQWEHHSCRYKDRSNSEEEKTESRNKVKNSNTLKCGKCNYKTINKYRFSFHKRKGCDETSSETSSTTSSQRTFFKCNNCSFKAANKQRLLKHKRDGCSGTSSDTVKSNTTLKKVFKCPLCFYKGVHKVNVENHFSMCHVEEDA